MNKIRMLMGLTLIQTGLLLAFGWHTTALREERDWLRAAYFKQQGVLASAIELTTEAVGIAERYAHEAAELRRGQQRIQIEAYIRSVNATAPAQEISDAILQAADETGIEASWLIAKIKQESYFNPAAVSRTGCRGLVQICRAAAADVGLSDAEAFTVAANVRAGARYLRMQLDRTGGDMARALARYNGNDDPAFVRKIERHRARFLRGMI